MGGFPKSFHEGPLLVWNGYADIATMVNEAGVGRENGGENGGDIGGVDDLNFSNAISNGSFRSCIKAPAQIRLGFETSALRLMRTRCMSFQ